MSDAAMDTSSEITTKDLYEKKEFVEHAENGRDAPAIGNANKKNGEQGADNEVDEEEEEGGEEEEEEVEGDGEEEGGDEDEETEAAMGKWTTEDDEDDVVDTKKQKTDEGDKTAKKGNIKLKNKKGCHDLFSLHFQSQNLNMVTFKIVGKTQGPRRAPSEASDKDDASGLRHHHYLCKHSLRRLNGFQVLEQGHAWVERTCTLWCP
ncbi:prothymosin alpha-like [Choloepus didactylus]|uniref:prothymosin alpha-like n=1 Tax=Choloepus didactylus TaxID=27675 RepID=UPI00189D4AA9|nr:prothymosin alpha-like [Choloepus didactylus]